MRGGSQRVEAAGRRRGSSKQQKGAAGACRGCLVARERFGHLGKARGCSGAAGGGRDSRYEGGFAGGQQQGGGGRRLGRRERRAGGLVGEGKEWPAASRGREEAGGFGRRDGVGRRLGEGEGWPKLGGEVEGRWRLGQEGEGRPAARLRGGKRGGG